MNKEKLEEWTYSSCNFVPSGEVDPILASAKKIQGGAEQIAQADFTFH